MPAKESIPVISSRAHTLLMGFALLGLIASTAASWVHYHLLIDPSYSSFCDVSATVNCTEAYMSSYGSFFGTPVALLGLLWFVGVLALLWAGRPGAGKLAQNVA